MSTTEIPFIVDNWPMNLEATRERLQQTQRRLERYRAALRLAGVEIERRNRGIIALTAFAYQASSTANPTTLLKLALFQAMETINTPVGAIVIIDPETKALILNIHKGLTIELIDILTGRELGHGAPALMPHLVTGSGALLEVKTTDDEMEHQLLAAGRLTSLTSLPIQLGPKLMGALLVGLQDERKFGSAELCFLMAISQETAIALEGITLREGLWHTAEALLGNEIVSVELQVEDQATFKEKISTTPFKLPVIPLPQPAQDDLEQLLAAMMEAEDEVQQQNADLQALNTIAEAMNHTLNLKEILQHAVEQTRAILAIDATWIYLFNEKNQLDLVAHMGLSTTYVRGMRQLALGESLEGQVAAENMAQFIEIHPTDTHTHKIWVDKEKLQALAAVPITRPEVKTGQTGSHVLGVLAAGKRMASTYRWSPREVRLLSSVANQLALAIENARLYTQIQEDHAHLRAGNEILHEINEMLLQRNAFLEEFIQDDLGGALVTASLIMNRLLAENESVFTEMQKQAIIALQKIVNRLDKMAQRVVTST